ncbi:MAG: hypothetical protein D6695_12490 [Planctomycetota bacterium]|nr:MAG: hypothetical protein D6695_12490 [Planctomycetota bacterium]
MNEDYERLSAERLIDAAEAVLLAVAEVAELSSGHYVDPMEMLGSSFQPECLCDFTREEIVEATAFLHRLGVLNHD